MKGEFLKRRYKVFLTWWSVGLLLSIAVLVPVARAHWQVPMEPHYYRAAVFAAEGYCLAPVMGGLLLYVVAGLIGFFETALWLYNNTPRFVHVARAAKAAWREESSSGV